MNQIDRYHHHRASFHTTASAPLRRILRLENHIATTAQIHKPVKPTVSTKLQLGIKSPGPAPVNVAADTSAVGEPEPVAGEASSVSGIEPSSVSPGTVDVDVIVSAGGVSSVGVVVGSWLSAVETSEASTSGLPFVSASVPLLWLASSVDSSLAGSRTGSAVAWTVMAS